MKTRELKDLHDEMMGLYNTIKREVASRNQNLYERWKAGGFIVDDNVCSMYPNSGEVMDALDDEDEEETET